MSRVGPPGPPGERRAGPEPAGGEPTVSGDPPGGVRVTNVAPPLEGRSIRVDVGGRPVAVIHVGGRLFAVDARCPHVGGPLDRGRVTDGVVQCPWHGSQFDLATGKLKRGPATSGVQAYAVRVEGSDLLIERR